MKKVFIALIVLVICVLMAGCSKPVATPAPAASPKVTAPTPTPAPIPASSPAPTPAPTPTTAPASTSAPKPAQAAESATTPAPATEPAPTPGPNCLVLSQDIFYKEHQQAGEIRVAPGDTFTVNLAPYKFDNSYWEKEPEIINNGVAELVSFKNSPADNPAWQTWNFKATDKGSCVISFKTGGHVYEVREWTYTLSVAVMSLSISTSPVEFNLVSTGSQVTENATDMNKLVFTQKVHDFLDAHGSLEGKCENLINEQIDLMTGIWWARTQFTFTGKVNGKSGSFTRYAVAWGWIDPRLNYKIGKSSWSKNFGTIISGTGELANLRGTTQYYLTATPVEPQTDTPTYQVVGPTLGTFWFLE